MKIRQIQISKDNVINNTDLGVNTTHIRIKAPRSDFKSGLFINNNPYLIHPIYDKDTRYWDLDTNGNCWIQSIKFDYDTQNNLGENEYLLIEAFYEN